MQTNANANIKEVIVLVVNPSPIYNIVSIVNDDIPIPKPIKRPGHKRPSEYCTICLVPFIKKYDIVVPPTKDNSKVFLAAQSQRNCPFVWNQIRV